MKKNIIALLLSSALVACGGSDGGSSTPQNPDTGLDVDVRTYNFVYQGGAITDTVVSGIYEQFQSGQSTTTLHSNTIYGSSSENIIVQAVADSSGDVNVSFELRDGNTNSLLAAEQESIDSGELEQLVFAYGDTTLSSPEYELEVINRPKDQPTATSAPMYVINLLGQDDVNVFIDDAPFQSALESIALSNKYDVNLSSPLSKVSIKLLNNTELASCDVSGEDFAGKQSLLIFAKNASGSEACYITTY